LGATEIIFDMLSGTEPLITFVPSTSLSTVIRTKDGSPVAGAGEAICMIVLFVP